MKPNKVLILGHSIVRRFQQFLTSDADVRYCEDPGLRENHRIFYRAVGGRTISGILREDASFIEKVKPHNIILIVGGNDVRRAILPKNWQQILNLLYRYCIIDLESLGSMYVNCCHDLSNVLITTVR